MYPNAMASKRAFDRTLIRLFGFKDTYSDSEDVQSPKSKKAAQVASETSVYPDSPIIDFSDVEEEKPAKVTEDTSETAETVIGGMAERHIAEPIKNMAIPANATPFEVVSSDDEYEEELEIAESNLFASPSINETIVDTDIAENCCFRILCLRLSLIYSDFEFVLIHMIFFSECEYRCAGICVIAVGNCVVGVFNEGLCVVLDSHGGSNSISGVSLIRD